MRDFFSERLGFGRYPTQAVGEVFACDRRYFDQILHRNSGFKNRYARAFKDWAAGLQESGAGPDDIKRERVVVAVEVMGEDRVQKLFDDLLLYLKAQNPSCPLEPKVSFKETLRGSPSPGLREHLEIVKRFWARIALPEV